jgi:hypothetical protein
MRDFDEENYVGKWTKELDDELIRCATALMMKYIEKNN